MLSLLKAAKFGQLFSCHTVHVLGKKLLQLFSLTSMRLLRWWTNSVGNARRYKEALALLFPFLIALCEVQELTPKPKRSFWCPSRLDSGSLTEPPELHKVGAGALWHTHIPRHVWGLQKTSKHVLYVVEVNWPPSVCPDKAACHWICHLR